MADKEDEIRELKHELELTRLKVLNLELSAERNKKRYNDLKSLCAEENKSKKILMALAIFNLAMFVGLAISTILWG